MLLSRVELSVPFKLVSTSWPVKTLFPFSVDPRFFRSQIIPGLKEERSHKVIDQEIWEFVKFPISILPAPHQIVPEKFERRIELFG